MTATVTDVACTVCGCVCDDLTVTTDGGRVVAAERACPLAEPWFLAQSETDIWLPILADAKRAAAILKAAKYPLIYGLSRSTTEGQRAAVALADRLGATIDTTASTGHAPSILALQQVGESTCTLGEVKQRADLVIFWGSDPLVTHPRHIERYCPPRPGRMIVVVDEVETETAKAADLFVRVEPGRHWEALWELRTRSRGEGLGARGLPGTPPLVEGRSATQLPGGELASTKTPLPPLRGDLPSTRGGENHSPSPFPPGEGTIQSLAHLMTSCRFGIVFFGAGLTQQPHAHRVIEALLQLVTDLNDHPDPATRRRFYARRMRRYGDVAGADSVLAWQTGYPFGVNFAAGYPRYNPGEFTGPDILARKEADACVLVGSDTAKDLPPAALAHLKTIPVILLDPPGTVTDIPAAVKFDTAVYGVHRPGTAYRLDEVPIPLRVLLPTTLPADADVLNAILEAVAQLGSDLTDGDPRLTTKERTSRSRPPPKR